MHSLFGRGGCRRNPCSDS